MIPVDRCNDPYAATCSPVLRSGALTERLIRPFTGYGASDGDRQDPLRPRRFPDAAFGEDPLHVHAEVDGILDRHRHVLATSDWASIQVEGGPAGARPSVRAPEPAVGLRFDSAGA